MKMRFQDRVSYAISELNRAEYPPLEVTQDDLEAFSPKMLKRPPNVSLAIEILQSLQMIEARDFIPSPVAYPDGAKRMVAEKMARAIAAIMIRDNLIEIEIGDFQERGYPVRGRVRVMRPESE